MSLALICRVIEIVIISLHQQRYQWSQYLCLAEVNINRICAFLDDGMNQNPRIAKIKLILHLKSWFIIRELQELGSMLKMDINKEYLNIGSPLTLLV